jgi:hypothetical protein
VTCRGCTRIVEPFTAPRRAYRSPEFFSSTASRFPCGAGDAALHPGEPVNFPQLTNCPECSLMSLSSGVVPPPLGPFRLVKHPNSTRFSDALRRTRRLPLSVPPGVFFA